MLMQFIAAITAGVAGGLLAFALRHMSKGRAPKWLIPIFAGGAMLAATISMEYGWYDRTRANLAEDVIVASTVQGTTFYRPWTYLFPMTERFIAVDMQTVRTNNAIQEQIRANVWLFDRTRGTSRLEVLFDCAGKQSMAVLPDTERDANGNVTAPVWNTTGSDADIVNTACDAWGVS